MKRLPFVGSLDQHLPFFVGLLTDYPARCYSMIRFPNSPRQVAFRFARPARMSFTEYQAPRHPCGPLSRFETWLEERLTGYCLDSGVALFKLPEDLFVLCLPCPRACGCPRRRKSNRSSALVFSQWLMRQRQRRRLAKRSMTGLYRYRFSTQSPSRKTRISP